MTDAIEISVALAGCDEHRHPSWASHTQRAIGRLRKRGVTTVAQVFEAFPSLPAATRAEAAYVIARLGRKRDAAFLIARFAEERADAVKHAIVEALRDIGGKRAFRALALWLEQPDHPHESRLAAAHALMSAPGREEWLVDPLLRVAASQQEDPMLRGQALEAVGQHVGMDERRDDTWRRTFDVSLACLSDPHGEVRFWAIYAIGQLHALGRKHAERALPELRRLVETDEFIASLGWPNCEEARDVVHFLTTGELADPDAYERTAASRSTPSTNSSDS
jgi:HEAT repeat protein